MRVSFPTSRQAIEPAIPSSPAPGIQETALADRHGPFLRPSFYASSAARVAEPLS